MKKIVINRQYGGFSISKECAELMEEMGCPQAKAEMEEWRKKMRWMEYYFENGKWPSELSKTNISFLEIDAEYHSAPTFHGYGYGEGFCEGYARDSEFLISAVEQLKEKANGACASLEVVEIPDDVDWVVDEYDGYESIHEKHRSW